jgi:dienelactone hydrolase
MLKTGVSIRSATLSLTVNLLMQRNGTARIWRLAGSIALLVLAANLASAADSVQPLQGTVTFTPTAAESGVAERFRLAPGPFTWQADPLGADSKTVEVWNVTFPSPVVTPFEANNTVHCEYFQPKRPGKHPAVIVLHILGGDFPLSRLFCNRMAQQGVAALFVKMPFYGPRRGEGVKRRMISANPDETVEGMTQAVLDIRRATAWLAARDEVDAEQIGVFGISLGGITGALAATAEPRIQNICLLLAGGDIARVALDSPELKRVRGELPAALGDKETLIKTLRVIDPVTYAANARGRRILMLNADRDEVIPRACSDALYNAFGEPEIVWYPGGHYSVIRHLFSALDRVANFFAAVDGAGIPQDIYPLEGPLRWSTATKVSANRPLGHAGRFANPSPLEMKLAWDQENLLCSCHWPLWEKASGEPDRRKVRLYVSTGDNGKVISREVVADKPLGMEPGHLATIEVPWKELGVTPAAGQELRILASISTGEGEGAMVYTTGELPKQPVEQSVSRWPKYKLAKKP